MQEKVRVVIAACLAHIGKETYSTTVKIGVEESADTWDLDEVVRQAAADQLNSLYSYPISKIGGGEFVPNQIVCLWMKEDTVYEVSPSPDG